MTKNIASSWAKVFEADLFADFQNQIMASVDKLTKDVEGSAAAALIDRVKAQADLCIEEARLALVNTVEIVKATLNTEQKEISRSLAPHVQEQLIDGYERAMEERGTGSVARQKVRSCALRHKLAQSPTLSATECIPHLHRPSAGSSFPRWRRCCHGTPLHRCRSRWRGAHPALIRARGEGMSATFQPRALANLNSCVQVEVSIAALWEGVKDDPAQQRVRDEVVRISADVMQQIDLWNAARETRSRIASEEAQMVEDELMDED